MRRLINYIRSCFCKHDWEMLQISDVYMNGTDKYPCKRIWTYRCKKCGYAQTISNKK